MNEYYNLSSAETIQKVESDYLNCIRMINELPKYLAYIKNRKTELEDFMRSEYFIEVTEIDGEALIETLKSAAAEFGYKP